MKKKIANSRKDSKGGIITPKLKVDKTVTNERVDEIAKEIGALTYGQCTVLKMALDRRLLATRSIVR